MKQNTNKAFTKEGDSLNTKFPLTDHKKENYNMIVGKTEKSQFNFSRIIASHKEMMQAVEVLTYSNDSKTP